MASTRPGLIVIGAGASGRGHVGQLAFESGYDLTFIEKDRALVEALRRAGQYTVRLVGQPCRDVTIDRFEVFHLAEVEPFHAALRRAELVFTTVCPPNLPDVAEYLRPLLLRWLAETSADETRNVLCCENMDAGSTALKEMLTTGMTPAQCEALETRIGFPDAMIARVVAKPKDPLVLLGEEYSEWTAARAAFRGPLPPAIKTLETVDNQDRYLQRKLYIHNTGHATCG